MSKRFPIPEFDRDQYKNMDWKAPQLLSRAEQDRIAAAAQKGDAAAVGCYPVAADDAFYDRFKVTGEHRHAVMCVLPKGPVKVVGRSWAWHIQRALVVDSLDPGKAKVLHDWTTPRPMNTRLGPDDGVEVDSRVVYAVFGHRHGERWIANRTMRDAREAGKGGFTVISASDEGAHDFHACNLSFRWG